MYRLGELNSSTNTGMYCGIDRNDFMDKRWHYVII
jgi:hypothetical protein